MRLSKNSETFHAEIPELKMIGFLSMLYKYLCSCSGKCKLSKLHAIDIKVSKFISCNMFTPLLRSLNL